MSFTFSIDAKLYSQNGKSISKHDPNKAQIIEYWAIIGKVALANPDLPVEFVRDIIQAKKCDIRFIEPFNPAGQND